MAAFTIDLDVVVVLKLKGERGGLPLVEEEGVDLKDDGSFPSRGFEGWEEVASEGVVNGFLF